MLLIELQTTMLLIFNYLNSKQQKQSLSPSPHVPFQAQPCYTPRRHKIPPANHKMIYINPGLHCLRRPGHNTLSGWQPLDANYWTTGQKDGNIIRHYDNLGTNQILPPLFMSKQMSSCHINSYHTKKLDGKQESHYMVLYWMTIQKWWKIDLLQNFSYLMTIHKWIKVSLHDLFQNTTKHTFEYP